MLHNLSRTLVAIEVPQGAHHLDLMFSHPEDPPPVRAARDAEFALLVPPEEDVYLAPEELQRRSVEHGSSSSLEIMWSPAGMVHAPAGMQKCSSGQHG